MACVLRTIDQQCGVAAVMTGVACRLAVRFQADDRALLEMIQIRHWERREVVTEIAGELALVTEEQLPNVRVCTTGANDKVESLLGAVGEGHRDLLGCLLDLLDRGAE